MKDKYITAFDDLARIEFNDNPATFRRVGNSDPPSRAPYEERASPEAWGQWRY